MRAVVITAPGGPEVLQWTDLPQPVPGPDELLVRVHASGVNRADLLQRRGFYPAPPGAPERVPGLEFAGVVEEVGERATAWTMGDRVMGILGGGGYAEFVVVPASHALRVPDGMSYTDAAAIPEAFMTAHDALTHRAHLRDGERVLIHAVGSGVGVALLQLAKAAGATVAGTSRTGEKLRRATALGLDREIGVVGGFAPPTDLRNWADVICDLVGGGYLSGNLAAAAPRGRIVVIGLTGGRTAQIDLGLLLVKRLSIAGTVLRSRSRAEKAELAASFTTHVMPPVRAGRIVPVVDRVFPAAEASEAHRYMEGNRNFGAIVMNWESGADRLPRSHSER